MLLREPVFARGTLVRTIVSLYLYKHGDTTVTVGSYLLVLQDDGDRHTTMTCLCGDRQMRVCKSYVVGVPTDQQILRM